MPRSLPRRLGLAAAVALVPAIVLAVFFTTGGGIGVFVLLLAVGFFAPLANAALLSASVTVCLALVVGFVALLPDLHYRPDERFNRGPRYEGNVDFTQDMRFGDLVAIGGDEFGSAAEPRRVRFVTDAQGWRNARPYAEGDAVLIGDSFIAGTSSDQADTLAEQIRALTGRGAYSLAVPSAPADYIARLERFGRPGWLFVFEGNDLYEPERMCAITAIERPAKSLADSWRRSFPLVRKARGYWQKAHRAVRGRIAQAGGRAPAPRVVRHKIGGREMLFLDEYVAAAGRAHHEFPPCLVERARNAAHLIRGVFFVPTKYRVYRDMLDATPRSAPLADGNWRAVERFAAAAGVPAYDLTPALVEAARAALPEGRFVYWRDDTHWNSLGTRAAAREFARVASERK